MMNTIKSPSKKTRKKHYIPRKVNYDLWENAPSRNVANLPASCDDEMYDDFILTTVDLSTVRNAAANSLMALDSQTFLCSEAEVTKENCLRELDCKAQQYAWGKIGSDALVARLKAAQVGGKRIEEDKPYAELWIGTHPNGMSKIMLPSNDDSETKEEESIPLVDYVQKNPEMHLGVVGESAPSENYDLSFLFKVLSIEKVLSIQAHPDKHLAAQLFTDKPDVYKDPNHKPEMAVALTDDFEAMSGFRSVYSIARNLLEFPEFAELIGECRYDFLDFVAGKHGGNPKPILKKMFHAYMTADTTLMTGNLEKLVNRLEAKQNLTDLDNLIVKLAKQFPGDSGVYAPIIFNYLKLRKGDAFYIGANEPHAYIQGDILECMACSDNVVRAGLTPKLKDVDTLVKMLTYKCTTPVITRGEKKDSCLTLYVPPVQDFAMEIVEVQPGQSYELSDVRSPSIILTLDGSGVLEQGFVQNMHVSFGKAAFMSANTTAIMVADKDGPGLKIVRALSNVHLGPP